MSAFEWLLKNKNTLKDKILGAVCTNGTPIWNLTINSDGMIQIRKLLIIFTLLSIFNILFKKVDLFIFDNKN